MKGFTNRANPSSSPEAERRWRWVCWNTNGMMVWAGCSGHRVLLEHKRNIGLGIDAGRRMLRNTNGSEVWAWVLWSPYALGTRAEFWFEHGCSCHRVLLEHERNSGLGMDALVTECSWNTNGILVWAWMLWSPSALGTRTELWSGHDCSATGDLYRCS